MAPLSIGHYCNWNLASVNQYLKDHGSVGASKNDDTNNIIVVGVLEAMADYPTSYASLVVQWEESGGDKNQGNLTPSKFSDFSIDDNDGDDYAGDDASVTNAKPNKDDNEIIYLITKLVADLAISELEDIGFDAQFLETDNEVTTHRLDQDFILTSQLEIFDPYGSGFSAFHKGSCFKVYHKPL